MLLLLFPPVSCLARLLQVHPHHRSHSDDADRGHQTLSRLYGEPARKGGAITHTNMEQKSARQEAVIPLMCVFVEGARVGWILAAEHPAAVSSHPVSAVQRSHSHTAPGEGRSHSSRHVHTHTGTIRFFP